MGWSAGKWMEWYPDVLSADGKLTTAKAKPYWQSGWLKQHDRLVASMAAMKGRIPLTISGDLHAIGIGKILRSGKLDLEKTPITAILSGPIGTGPLGWPSGRRGVGSTPPAYLDVNEEIKPIEQHGFTIADFSAGSDPAAVLQVGRKHRISLTRSTICGRSTAWNWDGQYEGLGSGRRTGHNRGTFLRYLP